MQNLTSAPPLDSSLHQVPTILIVMLTIIWPTVIIFGMFGNTLSLIVLGKTNDSSSSSKFLINLAFVDTMTVIVNGIQMVYTWGEIFWPHQSRSWVLSSFAFSILSRLFDRISKSITVAIVSDRLIAVAMPFRYKDIVKPFRITILIAMIYVINACTSLPSIWDVFEYHIQAGENKMMGEQYRLSRLSQSKLKAFHFLLNILVFDFIPVPLVLVCNIIIVICLQKNTVKKSKITTEAQQQRKRKERELTKLLLTISTLFLFLAGPQGIYVFIVVAGASSLDPFTIKLVMDILLTLSLVNSSINFIVYAVMNTKYRQGYIEILCCCRRDNDIE